MICLAMGLANAGIGEYKVRRLIERRAKVTIFNGHEPLEEIKVRILNTGLLDLYQSRAGAGGYPPARLKRVTFMTGRVL